MGVLLNKVDRRDLRLGDHIYSWRTGYAYAHHGIFVGDNGVVHFTRGPDKKLGAEATLINSFVSSSIPKQHLSCPRFPDSCVLENGHSGVISSCLDCFLEGGSVHRFEYGVSTAVFLAQVRGGTCTFAQSDPPGAVIHRAKYLLQNGFVLNYDLFSKNCEDFAIYCKTEFIVTNNDSISGQVASMRAAARSTFNLFCRYVTSAAVPAAARSTFNLFCRYVTSAAVPVSEAFVVLWDYSIRRYKADIGVRDDKVRVPVEILAVNVGRSNGIKPPVAYSSTSEAVEAPSETVTESSPVN